MEGEKHPEIGQGANMGNGIGGAGVPGQGNVAIVKIPIPYQIGFAAGVLFRRTAVIPNGTGKVVSLHLFF